KEDESDMNDDSEMKGRGGGGACRHCGKKHRGVYEKVPGSGVWYVRVAWRGRLKRKMVGPHGLALKVYAQWKAKIAEGTFFPNAIATSEELLADALKAYLGRRTDLAGRDGERIVKRWMESPEVKAKTVRDFTTEDAERFLKRRGEASTRYCKSTRNHDVSYLHTFFEDYEDRRRRDRKRAAEPPIANPMKGLRQGEQD